MFNFEDDWLTTSPVLLHLDCCILEMHEHNPKTSIVCHHMFACIYSKEYLCLQKVSFDLNIDARTLE